MTFLFSSIGLNSDQATKFACMMGFAPHCVEPAADFFMKMYNLFIDKDITMLEINPLTEISTGEGKVGFRHSFGKLCGKLCHGHLPCMLL